MYQLQMLKPGMMMAHILIIEVIDGHATAPLFYKLKRVSKNQKPIAINLAFTIYSIVMLVDSALLRFLLAYSETQ